MKYYTIYKITNKIDGKIYIGKHETKDLDDGYMGSGKILRRAQQKYGIENFVKEILHVFNTEEEMNAKERELVSKQFVEEDTNYNLCQGGKGGFGYINDVYYTEQKRLEHNRKSSRYGDKDYIEKHRDGFRLGGKNGGLKRSELIREGKIDPRTFLGKTHTEETKQKMRKTKNVGSNNSQFGTMWITNGKENKKIKSIDNVPEGWYKGRVKSCSTKVSADLS